MLAAGKLRIGVSCIAKCTAKVKLLAGKTLARKLKLGRSRVVATGSAKRGGAGKLSVRLVVPASLRARLRRLRSARLTLELVLVQTGTGRSAGSRCGWGSSGPAPARSGGGGRSPDPGGAVESGDRPQTTDATEWIAASSVAVHVATNL
jgi:hypothetical protein